ncbi:DNA mismatch repair protein MutS [Sphingomonas sp. IBVSS2]|nr:DNA mismatch repair protein MutS [Sphingomonas sp. IBVSS2]
MASVTPLEKRAARAVALPEEPAPAPAPAQPLPAKPRGRVLPPRAAASPAAPVRGQAVNTLDGSWDRRLARGLVAPDSTVDLHGHSLASAYDRLDFGLEAAIGRGDRVLLLVTGKPPRRESERPHARGAIRAAVGDWLASSRHSDRIAAVRTAHSRHGGAGALYIVLRRPREKS